MTPQVLKSFFPELSLHILMPSIISKCLFKDNYSVEKLVKMFYYSSLEKLKFQVMQLNSYWPHCQTLFYGVGCLGLPMPKNLGLIMISSYLVTCQ